MLQKLKIRDFQGIEDRTFEFSSTVTVLVGPTNAGKSSTIRALRWVVLDRPLGAEFVREGTKETEVRLKLDNGTVARRKGKKNQYKADGSLYEAWGSGGPPEDVVRLVNMDELNFQGQHDAPFWFSLTSGEAAKRLNAIVDLSVIDDVLAEFSRQVRKAQVEQGVVEERAETARKELETYEQVPALYEAVGELYSKKMSIFTLQGKTAALERLVQELRNVEKETGLKSRAVRTLKAVIGDGNRAADTSYRILRLKELVNEAENVRSICNRELPDLAPFEKKQDEVAKLLARLSRLQGLVESINEEQREFDKYSRAKKRTEAELRKEMKGRCPVCGKML